MLIIKYLPQDGQHNNQLTATLHDIYENEVWLRQHAMVEDHIFVPAIRRLEQLVKQNDVTRNISADHLCISVNTVITHRRNIARKLQIHSPAGLTIYAIVNNLVDISSVKL